MFQTKGVFMSDLKFLAVDFGAGSGRTILGTIDDKIKLEEIHRFPNLQIKMLGHYHWDVLALFNELKQGLTRAAAQGHKDVLGIGVDTWGVDFGLIGKNSTLLGNPVAYRDARTDGMMEVAFEKISKKDIYQYTGIQFMQLNTIFQLVSMVQDRHLFLDVAEDFMFTPDLFNFLMTGEKVSEYTIASTSQLLNARERNWEKEIFSKLDIPFRMMPPIIQPGTVVGTLLKDVADETGLPQLDVIAPACHDTASAVAAVPAKSKNWAYLSSGTWSLLGVEVDEPIITQESLDNNFTNEGGVGGTIRFLRNTMGMWLLEGCKKSWESNGKTYDYGQLLDMAAQAKAFKCIIDPDNGLFLNPPDMPTAINEFCNRQGITPPENKGEYVRCILESLALKYRYIIEKINQMKKEPIDALHIVGGGSQNHLLNQFTADATGLPVIAGPIEATALGNILVQALAKKKIESLAEGRQLVANSFPLKNYEPADTNAWNDMYEKVKTMFV